MPDRQELWSLFAACATVVHAWAALSFLNEVPALLLRMSVADLLGAAAYTFVFALLESLLLTLAVAVLSVPLPPEWLPASFALRGLVLWVVGTPCLVVLIGVRGLGWVAQLVTLLSWLLVVRLFLKLLRRAKRVQGMVLDLLDRLQVLVTMYIALDLSSVVIVAIRNWR